MYRCIGVAMMLIGSLGHRFIGIGVSVYRCIGAYAHWFIEHRFIGTDVSNYRCIGASEY